MNSASTYQTAETLNSLDKVISDVISLWRVRGESVKRSIEGKSKSCEALALLDKANDGSWIIFVEYNKDGYPIFPPNEILSNKFCKEFGYERYELPTSGYEAWRKIINQSYLKSVDDGIMHHIENGGEFKAVVEYIHKDGSKVKILCRGDSVADKAGRPSIMYGTHTNLTKLGI